MSLDLDVSGALDVLADGSGLLLRAAARALQHPRERPARVAPVDAEPSRELARTCGLAQRFPDEDPTNLQRVALLYEIARSRHQLVEAIANAVQLR